MPSGASEAGAKAAEAVNAQEDIEFLNLRVKMYGDTTNESETADEAEPHGEDKIGGRRRQALQQRRQGIYTGTGKPDGETVRPTKKLAEILSWEEAFSVSKDVILEAFSYCYEREKTGLSYIKKW